MYKFLKIILPIAFVIIVLSVMTFYFFFIRAQHIRTEVSPNGEYKMEIYREPLLFSMPGGGSDQMAKIILKDKNNKKIGTVDGASKCKAMYRDLEIRWDIEANFAFYSRGNAFNLKTGKTCE